MNCAQCPKRWSFENLLVKTKISYATLKKTVLKQEAKPIQSGFSYARKNPDG